MKKIKKMRTKKTPTEFIRWLKEKDVYSKYIANFHEHTNQHNRNGIVKCLEKAIKHMPTTPLQSRYIGFDWESSNEGQDFWDNLSEKS